MDIRPGVAAILRNDEERILLHRRRVGGGWAPPSGAVEAGENVQSALLREMREETRLEVRIERLIAVYSDPAFQVVHYPDGRTIQFVTCLFACRRIGGELCGSEEGTAWGWFSPYALPEDLTAYAKVWLADAALGTDAVIVR